MHEKVVLPMRLDWIAMLLMIGFFGFFAQVRLRSDGADWVRC